MANYMSDGNHSFNKAYNVIVVNHSNQADDFYSSPLYQIAVPFIFGLIVVFGTIGNVMVIRVIIAKKEMHTPINILLLNLALADISFLVICGGFTTLHYALSIWPFGDMMCRIIQYLLYVTCYVSVYTLVAVAVVRYMFVCKQSDSRWLGTKCMVFLSVATWIIFLICKIPILIVHGISKRPDSDRVECIISGKQDGKNLFASFFVFAYLIPLLSICVVYYRLIKYLCSMDKQRMCTAVERTRHVTIIVILIVTIFAAGWLPLHLHLLFAYYGTIPNTSLYKSLLILWHCLSYFSSAFNPIIYNVFSTDFRNAFKETMSCRKDQTETIILQV